MYNRLRLCTAQHVKDSSLVVICRQTSPVPCSWSVSSCAACKLRKNTKQQYYAARQAAAAEPPGSALFADQFENLANFRAHLRTGREIISQTRGALHAFVAGAGTGGTIAGVSRALKAHDPHIKVGFQCLPAVADSAHQAASRRLCVSERAAVVDAWWSFCFHAKLSQQRAYPSPCMLVWPSPE